MLVSEWTVLMKPVSVGDQLLFQDLKWIVLIIYASLSCFHVSAVT